MNVMTHVGQVIQSNQIKARIAKQFGKAAVRYDNAAQVQLDIAFDALQCLPETPLGIALDIGCGTGRITQKMAPKTSQLFALDLAEGMARFAANTEVNFDNANSQQKITWLAADAESLPFQDHAIDTVFSSMALQWCMPVETAMQEIYRVLKPSGQATLAILCDGSMSELKTSWQSVDSAPHVNRFESHDALITTAENCGFKVKARTQRYTTLHHNILDVLNSIKSIGANVLPQTGNSAKLSRNMLAQLEQVYFRKFAEKDQLPLGYQVSFLQLHKLPAKDVLPDA